MSDTTNNFTAWCHHGSSSYPKEAAAPPSNNHRHYHPPLHPYMDREHDTTILPVFTINHSSGNYPPPHHNHPHYPPPPPHHLHGYPPTHHVPPSTTAAPAAAASGHKSRNEVDTAANSSSKINGGGNSSSHGSVKDVISPHGDTSDTTNEKDVQSNAATTQTNSLWSWLISRIKPLKKRYFNDEEKTTRSSKRRRVGGKESGEKKEEEEEGMGGKDAGINDNDDVNVSHGALTTVNEMDESKVSAVEETAIGDGENESDEEVDFCTAPDGEESVTARESQDASYAASPEVIHDRNTVKNKNSDQSEERMDSLQGSCVLDLETSPESPKREDTEAGRESLSTLATACASSSPMNTAKTLSSGGSNEGNLFNKQRNPLVFKNSSLRSPGGDGAVGEDEVGASNADVNFFAAGGGAANTQVKSPSSSPAAQHSLPSSSLPKPPSDQNGSNDIAIVDRDLAVYKAYKMVNLDKDFHLEPNAVDLGIVALSAIELSELYRNHHTTNGKVVTTPLTTANQHESGVYRWKNTIGQTGTSFLDRGKRRLEQEGRHVIKGKKAEVVRQCMSFVHTAEACDGIMTSPPFRPVCDTLSGIDAPRLNYHHSRALERKARINHQCVEAAVASNVEGYTHRVLEDFTTQPSDEINAILKPPSINRRYSKVVSKATRIFPCYTWGTPPSWFFEIMRGDTSSIPDGLTILQEHREFIQDVVNYIHDDGFLQNYMFNQVFGYSERVMKFTNCLPSKYHPRVQLWVDVLTTLRSLLTPQNVNGVLSPVVTNEVINTVNRITNEGPVYQAPPKDVLRKAYNNTLLKLSNELMGSNDVMITLEWTQYNELSDETKGKLFPPGSKRYYQKDIDGVVAEMCVETPDGHPDFRVTYSPHVMLGENSTALQRQNSCKRLIAAMALNNHAGILSDEDFDSQIRLYRCFLMNWTGLDGTLAGPRGSFNQARKNILPPGLCNLHFAREGVLMTANVLGVKEADVVFLRAFLGLGLFNELLTCFGRPTSVANLSPLDDPSRSKVWKKDNKNESQRKRNEEKMKIQKFKEAKDKKNERAATYGAAKYGWKTDNAHLSTQQQANREELYAKQAAWRVKRTAAKNNEKDQKILAEALNSLKRYNDCRRKGLDWRRFLFVKDLKSLVRYIIKVENRDGSDYMPQTRPKLLERLDQCNLKDDNENVDLNMYF